MNRSPDLRDHPSPMVCPLRRIGGSSPPPEHTTDSSDNHYNYQAEYKDAYSSGDNSYHKKENGYSSKQNTLLKYYHQSTSFTNSSDSNVSPLIRSTRGTYQKQNSLDLSSLSLETSYWEHDNYRKSESRHSDSSPEFYNLNTESRSSNESKYLIDNFNEMGKYSPSFDQGYHTLISPSPASTKTTLWREEDNLFKGKILQRKNNSFDKLPDVLVVKIFTYLKSMDLSVCSRVCKRFDKLVWNPILWRNIYIEGENISGDKAVRGVLRQLCGQGRTGACPYVQKLFVVDGAKITDRGLLLLARRCPELVHLQVHASTISNGAVYEVISRCPNIQHVDVTGNKNVFEK